MLRKFEFPSTGHKNLYIHKVHILAHEMLWKKNRKIEQKEAKIGTLLRIHRAPIKKQKSRKNNLSSIKNDWHFPMLPRKKTVIHHKIKLIKIEQRDEINSRRSWAHRSHRINLINWIRFSLPCWRNRRLRGFWRLGWSFWTSKLRFIKIWWRVWTWLKVYNLVVYNLR